MTLATARFIEAAASAGFPVLVSEKVPEGVSNATAEEQAHFAPVLAAVKTVPTDDMAEALNGLIHRDITVSPDFRRLTVYHYRAGEGDTLLLLNEDPGKAFDGTVAVSAKGTPVIYDALDNLLRPIESKKEGGKMVLSLHIDPLEMTIISFGG